MLKFKNVKDLVFGARNKEAAKLINSDTAKIVKNELQKDVVKTAENSRWTRLGTGFFQGLGKGIAQGGEYTTQGDSWVSAGRALGEVVSIFIPTK